eukprot:scaffold1925_cov155-Skeletonema_marinoi.AAC.3
MSDSPASKAPFKAPLLLQSETGIMRRGSAVDSLDTSNHHNIVSTENSVVSSSTSERDPNGKKLSSGGSTVTSSSTSSSGMSHSANERKELTHTQDDKARTPIVLQMNAPPHPVAEFLFQLTKMLTDDNKQYIEWRKASIFVTDPPGLEKFILPKYFRHSNYSSFQRQMNYFGFRKIAGKGKMAPCSYVNENAKEDISSLLFIKRKKTGVSNKAANVVAQHSANQIGGMNSFMMGGSGLMGGISHPSLLSLNGRLHGMGGGLNHQMMPGQMQNSNFNEAALYREQQQMLAQLQHAHASATSDSGLSGASANGLGGQSKANSSFGSNIFNTSLQTTDQGNVYKPSTDNSDWHTQYPSGLDAQAHQMRANVPQGNNMGIDSSANLRALLNQQISFFNNSDSTGAPGTIPQNMNQGYAMQPTRQDKEVPNANLYNDQAAAAPAGTTENDALIRQLEQQLFEAQTMNGMGGLMGIPRGSGN